MSGDRRELHFLPDICAIERFRPDRVMIDIPIGLPDFGNRACDLAAKKILRKAHPRVFTGARRNYWELPGYAAALRYFYAREDVGMSKQLWCLGPKIAEVDSYMTPGRQRTIRETHPELIFQRLNDGTPLPNKTGPAGEALRRDLLRVRGFVEIEEWLSKERRYGTGAKRGDVLDACACALAGASTHRVPESEPDRDAKGLSMEIWY
jgi:predicted RNase H-like nuclease